MAWCAWCAVLGGKRKTTCMFAGMCLDAWDGLVGVSRHLGVGGKPERGSWDGSPPEAHLREMGSTGADDPSPAP